MNKKHSATGYHDRSIFDDPEAKPTKAKLVKKKKTPTHSEPLKKKRELLKPKTHAVVRLPIELMARLVGIAEQRGTDIPMMLEFMLRDREALKVRVLKLKSKMPFGKYEGLLVEDVIRNNVNYARWIEANVDKVEFDNDCIDLIERMDSI